MPAAHPQSSTPPCLLHAYTPPARLQRSRSPYLHTCTPAANLQSSRTLEANPTSTHLRHASKPRFLHAYTPAARLPSSIPPHVHARSTPTEPPSSIPLLRQRLQRVSRS